MNLSTEQKQTADMKNRLVVAQGEVEGGTGSLGLVHANCYIRSSCRGSVVEEPWGFRFDPRPPLVGWGSSVAVGCGVGHRCGLDPTLLWLWCRPAAVALIWPPAWEPPCALGAALKKDKRQKTKKKNQTITFRMAKQRCSTIQHRELYPGSWYRTGWKLIEEKEYMCMYAWVALLYSRNQQDIVINYTLIKKINWKSKINIKRYVLCTEMSTK